MPLPSHFRTFGIETVTIVHSPETADETRLEAEAHIQGESGFFGVETPIYEGDIVERPDPRGGMERRLVATVKINDPKGPAFRDMVHTKVTWGKAPPTRVAPVRRLTVENLHSHVMTAAGALFADGHADAAVSEAVKSLETRIRAMTASTQSGVKLMNEAFGGDQPRLVVATAEGQSGRDEQEGFLALYRGTMLAIRNPRAHNVLDGGDAQLALEHLGFISLLHRRLDGVVAHP